MWIVKKLIKLFVQYLKYLNFRTGYFKIIIIQFDVKSYFFRSTPKINSYFICGAVNALLFECVITIFFLSATTNQHNYKIGLG